MSEPAETLICIKCDGRMRTYQRNGITIDQCRDCRGIFLDRGELEQLISAESAFLATDPPARRETEFLGDYFD